ncbi:MAG TPA: LamG domain-containing protein [Gammaproteobacteria bacterium]|nr:LamG domain-containing protein [Gammaproteobacteria bacterium]
MENVSHLNRGARLADPSASRGPYFLRGARAFGRLCAASAALVLAVSAVGCSGGSGPAVVQNPASGGGRTDISSYTGPAPDTADVQSFKINLYDNIRTSDRCGACHSEQGGQTPMFARGDDVNLAYAAANGIVNLASPEDSLMVQKVGGGHNCWLSSDSACADILTTWITNWAGTVGGSAGRKIQLKPPPARDPGQSRSFPADPSLFETTVYPLLDKFCSRCHASSTTIKQQPFFAEGPSTDPDAVATAYEAAKARINLDDPASSRFVVRLREDHHNCWSSDCSVDASKVQAAIETFAQGVPLTQVDPQLVTSKASTLYEGTIASGGNRYEASQIALYEFKTGVGGTAFDTSGVEPAMDLTLSGQVQWVGGWGLAFTGGKAQASTAASAKLRQLVAATGEYSIEAWAAPGNVVQEDRRIVSYSAGAMARNFNLGQTKYDYELYNRSSSSDENGNPPLATPDDAQVLQATLQHVVATYDPVAGRKLYVNGVLVSQQDPAPVGTLDDWDDTFAFVLGNEVSGDKPWNGVLRLVAIHNRALTPEQIKQNYAAGVGERFFVMFDVTDLVGLPQSYIVFEVSQFDSYAYLFKDPYFISLDSSARPDGIALKGIRIGINGAEAPVGQSFAHIDTVITSAAYDSARGEPLSNLGAVVPLEKGPDSDEFFLSFDQLGSHTYARPAPATPPAPAPQDLPATSDIGVRTFDEINATMSAITGVSPLDSNVRNTFETVRQSLPAVPSIQAVLASHQVSIAQLAIEYCNALMEDTALRGSMFPTFPFGSEPSVAFPGSEDALFDPLFDRMLGATQIQTQPDRAAVKTELDQMINGIPGDATRPGLKNTGNDDAERTLTIAKSVCSAMLGSAAMLID